MSTHDYMPEEALRVLMGKLSQADEHLANEIQEAIDAGKDVAESEPSRNRRKKPRKYRKTVPYSYEEALHVALAALQAHFIEQPLFANSCAANLAKAAIGIPKQFARFGTKEENDHVELQSEGEEKAVVIEMQTETQISPKGQEVFEFKIVSDAEIDEQRRNLERLKEVLDFK